MIEVIEFQGYMIEAMIFVFTQLKPHTMDHSTFIQAQCLPPT